MNSKLEVNGEREAENSLLESHLDADGAKIVASADVSPSRTNINRGTGVSREEEVSFSLETPSQLRQRRHSHLIIYATTFIMAIGFSIVLTGVWPYLKQLDSSSSKEFLGWVIAVNPLGQMIASPILGWWGSYQGSNRISLVITVSMFIMGSILYAVLPLFNHHAKYVMLLSRFIVGISSANISLCRAYIATSTKMAERTTALSITAASQALGYILGPSLQTALAYAFPGGGAPGNASSFSNFSVASESDDMTDIPPPDGLPGSYQSLFNMYSMTGWLTATLGGLNLFLLLPCVYKEFSIAEMEEKMSCLPPAGGEGEGEDDTGLPPSESDRGRGRKTDYPALCVLLVTFFSVLLVYVLLETLIVPMCLDLYAWTPEFAVKAVGGGLTVAGVISLFVFLLSSRLAKLFNDRKVFLLGGLLPLTLSMLIFFPVAGETPVIKYCAPFPPGGEGGNGTLARVRRSPLGGGDCVEGLGCPSTQEWCFTTPKIHISQLITASCFTTFGYTVCVGLAGPIYSKMIRVKEQGLWMGVLTSAGSLSRFLGPLFVSYLYTAKGPLWLFGILFVLQLGILILCVVFYRRMAPLVKQGAPPGGAS